jgi:hypothetical protein
MRLFLIDRTHGNQLTLGHHGDADKPSFALSGMPAIETHKAPRMFVSGETSDSWHLYGDYKEFQQEGAGIVRKRQNLLGIAPITVGLPVVATTTATTTSFGAGYRLGGSAELDWGVSAGLQYERLQLRLHPLTETADTDRVDSAYALLPAAGGFIRWRPTVQTTIHARYQGAFLGLDNKGHSRRASTDQIFVGADWCLSRQFFLGVGYTFSRLRYTHESAIYQSSYGYAVTGAGIFAGSSF